MLRLVKRKLVTFVKRPHKAIRKYFKILILREVLPLYNENYDECWGCTSYKNKTVLDLGADYGSTAYYFLKRGARKVVAVEGDKTFASKLKRNYGGDGRVVCVQKWIGCPADFEELIRKFPLDLAKVDVEGAEKHLVGVQPEALLSIDEWLIEAHTKQVCDLLTQKFLKSGFKVFASRYDILGVYQILHCTNKLKRR